MVGLAAVRAVAQSALSCACRSNLQLVAERRGKSPHESPGTCAGLVSRAPPLLAVAEDGSSLHELWLYGEVHGECGGWGLFCSILLVNEGGQCGVVCGVVAGRWWRNGVIVEQSRDGETSKHEAHR